MGRAVWLWSTLVLVGVHSSPDTCDAGTCSQKSELSALSLRDLEREARALHARGELLAAAEHYEEAVQRMDGDAERAPLRAWKKVASLYLEASAAAAASAALALVLRRLLRDAEEASPGQLRHLGVDPLGREGPGVLGKFALNSLQQALTTHQQLEELQEADALLRRARERWPSLVTWTVPAQCPERHLPELSAKPWHDAGDFSYLEPLLNESAVVREELLAHVQSRKQPWQLEIRDDLRLVRGATEGDGVEGWSELILARDGQMDKENCRKHFPRTCAILGKIPELRRHFGAKGTGQINFFELRPGTSLVPHVGLTNARLTAHLGLITPPGPRIKVGTEERGWSEGELLVFDDSFVHSVWWSEPAEQSRFVLYLTLWHPDMNESLAHYLAGAKEDD